MKFKVGDRVRCVEDTDGRGKGYEGTVMKIQGYSTHSVGVEFDPPFVGHGPNGRWWNCEVGALRHARPLQDNPTGTPYRVIWDNGHSYVWYAEGDDAASIAEQCTQRKDWGVERKGSIIQMTKGGRNVTMLRIE